MNRIGSDAKCLAPEDAQRGQILIGVMLDPERQRFVGQAENPLEPELQHRHIRVANSNAIAISLGPLLYVQAHEVAKARLGCESVEALKPILVGRLAQQPVLALHGSISASLAGI